MPQDEIEALFAQFDHDDELTRVRAGLKLADDLRSSFLDAIRAIDTRASRRVLTDRA